MNIFIANRLSNGNGLFPVEIHIDDYSVTIKKPGLIAATEKTMNYRNISSVELNSPIFGFTKIKINTIGIDSMMIEGFERYHAEEAKRLIEQKIR
jgi:hypothetical protein